MKYVLIIFFKGKCDSTAVKLNKACKHTHTYTNKITQNPNTVINSPGSCYLLCIENLEVFKIIF